MAEKIDWGARAKARSSGVAKMAQPQPQRPAEAQPAPPIAGETNLGWQDPGYAEAMQPQPSAPELSWADVPGEAISNIPASAAQFGEDILTPITQPIETVKALGNLALGIVQKAIPGEQAEEQYADAIGQFLVERYGSMDAVKNTIAKDPVGFAADVSMVLTAGGTAAGRAPGIAGKVAKVTSKVGRAVDPLMVAGKGIKAVGRTVEPVVSGALGLATGAGQQAIRGAARAGAKGGRAARAFQDQLRGIAPVEDVVTDTKTALNRMRQERGAAYRTTMAKVSKDKSILDFGPIDDAVNKVAEIGVYKGQAIKPSTVEVMDNIRNAVDDWKKLDPSEYHTPEGLDALKQKLGDIMDAQDYRTQPRVVAEQVYNAVKEQIIQQAPDYAGVMKDYERASDLITDIEKTLSAKPNANVDTTVRKLQSIMRNNVQATYGRRVELGKTLAERGAPELFPRLSGQALSSPMPRGIQSALAIPTALGAAAINPALLPGLLATSPRVVGEAAYYGGKGAGKVGRGAEMARALLARGGMTPRGVGAAAFQSGRTKEELARALAGR